MTAIVTQQMPRLDTPLVNEDGTMNYIWYMFFQSIWKKSGLATTLYKHGVIIPGEQVWDSVTYGDADTYNAICATFKESPNLYSLYVYNQINGALMGKILLDPIPR